jgi:uncharacterized protein (TIGR03382 family)
MKRMIALATLMSPLVAHAYDVKTTTTGAPVHWADGAVVMTPALSPTPDGVTTDAATAVLANSVATWQAVLAGTGVTLSAAAMPTAATNHTNDGINSVRFAFDASDPDIEAGVLALTFVSFHTDSGVAVDADVVMNAVDFTWATSVDTCAKEYDLESALTHEVGHALGMAHSIGHPDATMYATGQACETQKRSLTADDTAGLDSLYRPDPASSGGCSATDHVGLLPIAFALAFLLRRRRVVAAVLALSAPVGAAQLRRLSVEQLSDAAVMVVRGHVVQEAPSPDAAIETDATIVVDECLAGACPRAVVVRHRGGERDGITLSVDAEAQPEIGASVIIYLRRDASGHFRSYGGVQGMWQIQGKVAIRDLQGQHLRVDDHWEPGDVETVTIAELRQAVGVKPASPAR